MKFSQAALAFDIGREIESISVSIREAVLHTLRRKGAVVAVSGGIDSAACAALCTHALGKESVQALFLPERDSSDDSLRFGRLLAERLGIRSITENIAPILEGAGCYRRQDEAVRMVFPQYESGWKFKISLPSILTSDRLNVSRLTIMTGTGESLSERMSPAPYLQLVAATNFKQRTRKAMEYYHADRLNYAVCGTPNRLEYDQGFFVKGGETGWPISNLSRTCTRRRSTRSRVRLAFRMRSAIGRRRRTRSPFRRPRKSSTLPCRTTRWISVYMRTMRESRPLTLRPSSG